MKDNKTVITSDAGMEYEFVYDHSIWSCDPKDPEFVGQEKLYELMGQPLLNSAFEGYNTCLFAYGQVMSVPYHITLWSPNYMKVKIFLSCHLYISCKSSGERSQENSSWMTDLD